MKLIFSLLIALAYAAVGIAFAGETLTCEPLVVAQRSARPPGPYGHGLLFKVSRPRVPPSHVFGTMHVGDAPIIDLPDQVGTALTDSQSFVMEAVLDAPGLIEFSALMFYQDGTRLDDKLGQALFARTANLLARYGIPEAAARNLKPWAVYMTLSLPPSDGTLPLDVVLMQRAQERGLSVYGLESVQEQAQALGEMSLEDQTALLKDTVCNFEVLHRDYAEMKALYLKRDLAGLLAFANKYQLNDEVRYERLMDALLAKRNRRMVDRMAVRLAEGKAFIAVGALHLTGAQGVLALLEQRGYQVSVVY